MLHTAVEYLLQRGDSLDTQSKPSHEAKLPQTAPACSEPPAARRDCSMFSYTNTFSDQAHGTESSDTGDPSVQLSSTPLLSKAAKDSLAPTAMSQNVHGIHARNRLLGRAHAPRLSGELCRSSKVHACVAPGHPREASCSVQMSNNPRFSADLVAVPAADTVARDMRHVGQAQPSLPRHRRFSGAVAEGGIRNATRGSDPHIHVPRNSLEGSHTAVSSLDSRVAHPPSTRGNSQHDVEQQVDSDSTLSFPSAISLPRHSQTARSGAVDLRGPCASKSGDVSTGDLSQASGTNPHCSSRGESNSQNVVGHSGAAAPSSALRAGGFGSTIHFPDSSLLLAEGGSGGAAPEPNLPGVNH